MNKFNISLIETSRYRFSKDADEILDYFRKTLVPGERYRGARLAIARSLAYPREVDPIPKGEWKGAIPGHILFGEESAVWAALIVQATAKGVENMDTFKALVEAHMHRGARLLQEDYDEVDRRDVDFAMRLAALAGARDGSDVPSDRREGPSGVPGGPVTRVSVPFGEVGIELRSNQPVLIEVNAPGVSPHSAFMGKTRSGKSRTGLAVAERVLEQAGIPFLLIDPKGEFVKGGEFVKKSEWQGRTIADRFPGAQPLDVSRTPVPLDFLALPPGAPASAIPQAAVAFRDSFMKCVKAKGDVAMDDLRERVDELLRVARGPIRLEDVRDAVAGNNDRIGKKKDTVLAKLNELTSFQLFKADLAPADFFSRRWVIGLSEATEESRRLVTFLLLDALARYLLALEDSNTDGAGYRQLRHLTVVDEAKEILAYRHSALSELIRKGAAKGSVVMLLSQSPDDFDKEDEDFLAQMGSIGVFTSTGTSVRSLRAALGRKLDVEDFSDRELPKGVALAKLPGRDAAKILAWR